MRQVLRFGPLLISVHAQGGVDGAFVELVRTRYATHLMDDADVASQAPLDPIVRFSVVVDHEDIKQLDDLSVQLVATEPLSLTTDCGRAELFVDDSRLLMWLNTHEPRAISAFENFLRPMAQAMLLTRNRGFLCHAASVSLDDVGILAPGVSTAGKTTFSTLIQEAGGRVFSDDLSLLVRRGEKWSICSSPFFGAGEHLARAPGEVSLDVVVSLEKATVADVRPLSRGEAAATLIAQIPFLHLLGASDSERAFDDVVDVANQTKTWVFAFRNHVSSIDALRAHLRLR